MVNSLVLTETKTSSEWNKKLLMSKKKFIYDSETGNIEEM